ncbi:MAG: pyridoxal phosphate-dependent aminotransferase [Marinilabiliaceae bacterium]|nr:pyridoxal phosphate-dependent aminotransferase [Marinilabiliaceae bacterium]
MYNFDKFIPREGTHAYKLEFRKKVFGSDDVLPLWVADMDIETPREVADVIQQRSLHEIYGYTVRGSWFQQSIMDWQLRRHQWHVREEWIEYAPGVVPSLVIAIMAFTNPDDKVLIQTPVYPPFYSVVKDNNRELVTNPLVEENGKFFIDFDLFDKQTLDPKLKLFILCNPHNPISRVWTRDELLKIAGICIKNNVLIISDEIHSDLMLFDNKHIPIASLGDDIARNTITCMAASKTFNIAGFSTSYIITSNRKLMLEYRRVLMSLHLFTGNVFGAIATDAAYRYGESWLNALLQYLEVNVRYVQDFFNNYLPEVNVTDPQATFLLWLDFRKWDLLQPDLNNFMVDKAKVALNDGASFGENGKGFMRLNVGSPRLMIEDGLNRILRARKMKM